MFPQPQNQRSWNGSRYGLSLVPLTIPQTSTTHLVWSLNDKVKPLSPSVMSKHTDKGSSPVNLFGQSEVRNEPEGAESFVLQTKVSKNGTPLVTTYTSQPFSIIIHIEHHSACREDHLLVSRCGVASG